MTGSVASPKATGGAGVVFEYRMAAVLLARLAAGGHTPIGVELPIHRIGLQQMMNGYDFDDIVVCAAADGPCVQMQVKTRLDIQGRDPHFIKVLASAARAVESNSQGFDEGRLRLALVCSSGSGLQELRELIMMTAASDCESLRKLLSISDSRYRNRHAQVVTAMSAARPDISQDQVELLVHRVLSNLLVWLVEPHPGGREVRAALDLLSGVLPTDGGTTAASVFSHLCQLAQEYGPRAGQIDAAMVRRDLRAQFGIHLGRPGPRPVQDAGANLAEVSQLPRRVVNFMGREAELDLLVGHANGSHKNLGHSNFVAAITGMPGIGKTSLATEAGHRLVTAYPDAQLYADLRGMNDHPLDPSEVLARFLRALGVSEAETAGDLDERSALFRSAISQRRVLIVLDNAASASQVEPLLPGAGSNCTLITSRQVLTDITTHCGLALDVLSEDEALDYLVAASRRPQMRLDPWLPQVARLCGFLPLALRIVASSLAGRRNWSPRFVAAELREESERLNELSAGESGVRASISLSYRRMPSATRRAFRLLAVVPDAMVPVPVAMAVMDLERRPARRMLDQISGLSLLDSSEHEKVYRFHDLIRLYALERLGEEEHQTMIAEAEVRLMTSVLERTRICGRSLIGATNFVTADQAIHYPAMDSALEWIDHHWTLITGVLRLASSRGYKHDTLVAMAELERYIEMRDLWSAWLDLIPKDEKGEPSPVAWLLRATTHIRLRNVEGALEAERRLSLVIDTWEEGGARAEVLVVRGNALRLARRSEEARECFQQALDLNQKIKSTAKQAVCMHNIGATYQDVGRYDIAVKYYREELAVQRKLKDRWQQAWTLNSMGCSLSLMGENEAAAKAHREALAIVIPLHADRLISQCLHDLGQSLSRDDFPVEAINCHMADVMVSIRLGDNRGTAMALLAVAALTRDKEGVGDAYIEQAVRFAQASSDPDTLASALLLRGEICYAVDKTRARADISTALTLMTEQGTPRRRGQLLTMAGMIKDLSVEERRTHLQTAIDLFDALADSHDRESAELVLKSLT